MAAELRLTVNGTRNVVMIRSRESGPGTTTPRDTGPLPPEPTPRLDGRIPRRGSQARRNYPPRVLGVVLSGICVIAVLLERGAPAWVWVLLTLNLVIWPHLALFAALRAKDPRRAERNNLLTDSLLAGVWVSLMAFNLLPSAVILTMVALDNIGVGGIRLFLTGLSLMALGMVLGILAAGLHIEPETSMAVMLASLPMLTIYPLTIGMVTYRLAQRLAAQRRETEALSRIDNLSGLSNRQHWEEQIAAEHARLKRQGGDCALLLLDIDHFKLLNDSHGHAAGDDAIRRVAAILRQELRAEDCVARYGGEEFAALLPGDNSQAGLRVAERLRRRIAEPVEGEPGVTISVGIAEFRSEVPTADAWMARADTALYEAKGSGRNRCVVFELDANDMPARGATAR